MSRANAALSLPPGDRDDAPTLDLGEALRDIPLVEDDAPAAPTLTDPRAVSLQTRLERHITEGIKFAMAGCRLNSERKYEDARTAFTLADEHLRDAASLSRRLADPRFSRAITKE